MISDNDLYRLALFLGTCAMMMIVLYHFLEVNASDEADEQPTHKNAGSADKASNMGITGDGVPLAAAAAAAGGSGSSAIGGGKGR
ncbi:dolichyl-diphosphooligosaccharide--protein glycosyltransferase subunit 4 [Aspergillus chevalieri]|uniref:Dolichyl-diphosphooligosaccharide--protein glycosyltransferase subunit 4 n=1 Tax=Aspergillus chevalieri TaxID=182096 RepID=A0A7R7VSY1_ASPCH|nr:uncharacterized protein ACHE_60109A [Aspergillus chevalieri]BCR90223.1 hypothetical protein ACHE_60109A [Aspergillus chevalieri]